MSPEKKLMAIQELCLFFHGLWLKQEYLIRGGNEDLYTFICKNARKLDGQSQIDICIGQSYAFHKISRYTWEPIENPEEVLIQAKGFFRIHPLLPNTSLTRSYKLFEEYVYHMNEMFGQDLAPNVIEEFRNCRLFEKRTLNEELKFCQDVSRIVNEKTGRNRIGELETMGRHSTIKNILLTQKISALRHEDEQNVSQFASSFFTLPPEKVREVCGDIYSELPKTCVITPDNLTKEQAHQTATPCC